MDEELGSPLGHQEGSGLHGRKADRGPRALVLGPSGPRGGGHSRDSLLPSLRLQRVATGVRPVPRETEVLKCLQKEVRKKGRERDNGEERREEEKQRAKKEGRRNCLPAGMTNR